MVHAPVIRNVIKRVIPDVPLKTASAPKKGAIRMTNITDFTDSKFIPISVKKPDKNAVMEV